MGLVPMGLLLHSRRSLHEIRMALHEIRSCMVRATRLPQAQQSGQLNLLSTHVSTGFFLPGLRRRQNAKKRSLKMKIFFLAPRQAIVATVAGADKI